MNKKFDITGIGNSIVDILVKVNSDFITRHGFTSGSMTLVDRPQADMLIKQFAQMPNNESQQLCRSGGSSANTIHHLRELGAKVAFHGVVANDDMGQIFIQDIKNHGVHNGLAIIDSPDNGTGLCAIMVEDNGQRTMATFLGVNNAFAPAIIDEELIAQSKILYCEGYLFDAPAQKQAFIKAAQLAKQHDVKLALSLSDAFCINRHRDDFIQFIGQYTDILCANEQEILALTQCDNIEKAMKAFKKQYNTPILAVTMGAGGAMVDINGQNAKVPAQMVKVVDTTGAGDVFAAGFLWGILHGLNAGECATLGVAQASKIIQIMGARI